MVSSARPACTALALLCSISVVLARASGNNNLEGMLFVLPEDNSPLVLADPSNLGLVEEYDDNQDRGSLADSITLPERASFLNLESRYTSRLTPTRHLRSLRSSSLATGKELQRGPAQKRALSIFMALPNPAGGTFASAGQEPERNLERGGKHTRPFGMPLRWG